MIGKDYKYKLVTRCFTYNHASYIEDAMRGFAMQETTFPVVTLIVDDASTDGEQEVICNYLSIHFQKPFRKEETEYAHIICATHKTNLNCSFVVLLLKYNHHSKKKAKLTYISEWLDNAKYVAICEGDDYWINSMKLQKQVDYMENHQDCFLCANNALVLWEGSTQVPKFFSNDFDSHCVKLEKIIGSWPFPTASLLHRSEIYKDYPEWTKKIYSGDMTLILLCAEKCGYVYYFKDMWSVYRRDDISRSSVSQTVNSVKVYEHLIMLYEEFDKYSNLKYHKEIDNAIQKLNKGKRFNTLSKRNKLLPFIFMPIYQWKRLLESLRYRIAKHYGFSKISYR